MLTEEVPDEHVLALLDSHDRQRRIIELQSTVLHALGFELGEVAEVASEGEETPPRWRWRLLKWWGLTTGGYLLLDATSVKVPGPMSWLGIDKHIKLLTHVTVFTLLAWHVLT